MVSLGREINLKLKATGELRPHEEAVPGLRDRLIAKMSQEGILRDPIVIDQETDVVLDGSHRLAALGRMGIPWVVCFPVEYHSRDVRLFRWFRVVTKPSEKLFTRIETELELRNEGPLRPSRYDDDLTGALIGYKGQAYRATKTFDLETVSNAVRTFDASVTEEGKKLDFLDETSISEGYMAGDVLSLFTPKLGKDEVLQAGLRGALLPAKSTMHVIPIRPLGIDYPIGDLQTGTDVLETLLESRRQRLIPAPAFHRGRLYRESVLVLE